MTFVITENCIKCKYTDCVEVCPVDAFYEGETMLVIHPDECLDCGTCEPECPMGAIKSDSDAGVETWIALARAHAPLWPNLTAKKPALPDAPDHDGEVDKFEKYFTPTPGSGPAPQARGWRRAHDCCGGREGSLDQRPTKGAGKLLRTWSEWFSRAILGGRSRPRE